MIDKLIDDCGDAITRLEKEIQSLRQEQKRIIKAQQVLKKIKKGVK